MANKNRTEVSAAIQALSAVVGETEHKESLDDNFAQNLTFRKDVADTDTATTGTKTIDFLDIDYITVNQTYFATTYTLSNVQQGEIKHLKIIKTSGYNISFASPTIDTTPDPEYMSTETGVLYKITNKDGTNIYATPVSEYIGEASETVKGIVEKATEAERNAGTADKYIDAELLEGNTAGVLTKLMNSGDWNMNTTNSITVAHGLTGSKIIDVTACVYIDTDAVTAGQIYKIDAPVIAAGVLVDATPGMVYWDGTNVYLNRLTTGFFDSGDFENTSYNRCRITIKHEP